MALWDWGLRPREQGGRRRRRSAAGRPQRAGEEPRRRWAGPGPSGSAASALQNLRLRPPKTPSRGARPAEVGVRGPRPGLRVCAPSGPARSVRVGPGRVGGPAPGADAPAGSALLGGGSALARFPLGRSTAAAGGRPGEGPPPLNSTRKLGERSLRMNRSNIRNIICCPCLSRYKDLASVKFSHFSVLRHQGVLNLKEFRRIQKTSVSTRPKFV
jgi:hypothetical protein